MNMNTGTKIIYILTLMLVVACGTLFPKEETPKRQLTSLEKLEAKYARYLDMGRDAMDSDGFIETDRCDSLLFSALSGLARPEEVNIHAAEEEDKPGKWLRRPTSYAECWESGESRSEISKDMLIGLIIFAYYEKDLDLLKNILYYGRDNSWIMGNGRNLGIDTFFGPVERSLLGRSIEALSGDDIPEASIPLIFQPCSDDPFYGTDCHLTLLYIMLAGELRGGLTIDELEIVRGAVDRSPGNPFFQALLGKYDSASKGIEKAIKILLDESLWPADRLPASADRCESWLIRRYDDDTPAYRDCSEKGRTHGGGDLLFTTWVIRKDT